MKLISFSKTFVVKKNSSGGGIALTEKKFLPFFFARALSAGCSIIHSLAT
jgi:hypothetical protein